MCCLCVCSQPVWTVSCTSGSLLCESHSPSPFTFLPNTDSAGGHCQVSVCVCVCVYLCVCLGGGSVPLLYLNDHSTLTDYLCTQTLLYTVFPSAQIQNHSNMFCMSLSMQKFSGWCICLDRYESVCVCVCARSHARSLSLSLSGVREQRCTARAAQPRRPTSCSMPPQSGTLASPTTWIAPSPCPTKPATGCSNMGSTCFEPPWG